LKKKEDQKRETISRRGDRSVFTSGESVYTRNKKASDAKNGKRGTYVDHHDDNDTIDTSYITRPMRHIELNESYDQTIDDEAITVFDDDGNTLAHGYADDDEDDESEEENAENKTVDETRCSHESGGGESEKYKTKYYRESEKDVTDQCTESEEDVIELRDDKAEYCDDILEQRSQIGVEIDRDGTVFSSHMLRYNDNCSDGDSGDDASGADDSDVYQNAGKLKGILNRRNANKERKIALSLSESEERNFEDNRANSFDSFMSAMNLNDLAKYKKLVVDAQGKETGEKPVMSIKQTNLQQTEPKIESSIGCKCNRPDCFNCFFLNPLIKAGDESAIATWNEIELQNAIQNGQKPCTCNETGCFYCHLVNPLIKEGKDEEVKQLIALHKAML